MEENCSTFTAEQKIKCLIFAAFAASINANLPSQSIFFIAVKSLGLVVEASIIAVIPFKQGGMVSGNIRSP
mgnify:CR=1 FL=1